VYLKIVVYVVPESRWRCHETRYREHTIIHIVASPREMHKDARALLWRSRSCNLSCRLQCWVMLLCLTAT